VDARRAGQAADDYTVYTVGYPADYHFRVGAENVEGTGPPRTLVAAAQFLCILAAVTCSFRQRTFCESNAGNFYVSNCHVDMPTTTRTFIQLSVFIYGC